MKQEFRIEEAIHPVANEIYTPSYDLVSVDNPTHRWIVAPGDFQLGEIVAADEFTLEHRGYMDDEGNEIHGVFAVRLHKNKLL